MMYKLLLILCALALSACKITIHDEDGPQARHQAPQRPQVVLPPTELPWMVWETFEKVEEKVQTPEGPAGCRFQLRNPDVWFCLRANFTNFNPAMGVPKTFMKLFCQPKRADTRNGELRVYVCNLQTYRRGGSEPYRVFMSYEVWQNLDTMYPVRDFREPLACRGAGRFEYCYNMHAHNDSNFRRQLLRQGKMVPQMKFDFGGIYDMQGRPFGGYRGRVIAPMPPQESVWRR